MKAFATKWLARFARQERIPDASLRDAIARAEKGLIDADLGGGVIKQRVARPGRGKSGGYRMLIAYRMKHRAIFLYAFAKKERENISPDELKTLREIGAIWLAAGKDKITRGVRANEIREVPHEDEEH